MSLVYVGVIYPRRTVIVSYRLLYLPHHLGLLPLSRACGRLVSLIEESVQYPESVID